MGRVGWKFTTTMTTAVKMRDSFDAHPWILISLFTLFLYLLRATVHRRKFHRLPPGPKGLPFVGNALQIPSEHPQHMFHAWAKTYGDIVYTEAFGHRTIIVSSQKIAKDLLEKRGAKYSSRPRFVMLVELLGWHPSTALLPYRSEDHRKQRRWIRSTFGEKKTMNVFDGLRTRETCILLLGLMESPDDFAVRVKRYTSAIVVESVYGHRITTLDDPYVMLMDRAMEETTATGTIGGSFVDIIPALKYIPAWMPGASFKRSTLHAKELVRQAHHVPYQATRDAMESGSPPASLVSTLVKKMKKAGRIEQEENCIRYAAGFIYGAATDTTKTVLMSFLLAMVLHPDVFDMAQKEVDRVIGKSRLPTSEDRPNLPYLECVLKEVYRWNVPLPLGAPHTLDEDDEYEGYHIQKGTNIMTNMWTICRDERIWDDPTAFRPERFLKVNVSESDPEILDPRDVVFGYGRRLCPGRLFADTTLFLAVACIAATLNIRKARDAEGREITPAASFQPSFISYPLDFVCAISPRSEAAKHLVAETLAQFA